MTAMKGSAVLPNPYSTCTAFDGCWLLSCRARLPMAVLTCSSINWIWADQLVKCELAVKILPQPLFLALGNELYQLYYAKVHSWACATIYTFFMYIFPFSLMACVNSSQDACYGTSSIAMMF